MPVTENIANKIANLEERIACLTEQLETKKTQAAQKAARKQIKLLENKLNQLYGFNNLAIGDWVCNGKPDLPGQIVELKQENERYEAWVIWDSQTVPQYNQPGDLTKQNPELFIWDWDNDEKAIIREFDKKPCDDFQTLLAFIETFQRSIKKALDEPTKISISNQLGIIHQQWQDLVKDKFRIGDRVRYKNQNATVHEYQYGGSLLYLQIKFDYDEYLLVSPENLEILGLAQQILNVEPTVTYPCTKKIPVSSITIDQSLQGRLGLDKATLQEYAEIIEENEDELDPVKVIQDERGNRWLWDGFHTIQVHIQKQKLYITATIELGTYEHAFNLSLGANARRGLKLSQADKRNNVKRAILANLTDDEGKPLSNRAIAQLCCVSHGMVNYVKKELFPPKVEPEEPKNLELIQQPQQVNLCIKYSTGITLSDSLKSKLDKVQRRILSGEEFERFWRQTYSKITKVAVDWLSFCAKEYPEIVQQIKDPSNPEFYQFVTTKSLGLKQWENLFNRYGEFLEKAVENLYSKTQEIEEPEPLIATSETSQSNDSQITSQEETGQTTTESEIEQLKVVNEEKPENITVYLREDIVYVKDSAADKRLVGYINRPAMVLENHSHSVDLLFWGDNTIKNVSKQDIGLMQQKVNMLARITTKQLAILIQKFNSPEDAIAEFVNQLSQENQERVIYS